METEKADVLNACDFEIKFIAFKPPMTLPQGSVVPRRFYFTFQLFTHPNVKTEIAEIKQDTGLSTDQEALIPG